MTKQTKDAWMRMRTAWMKRGDTDLVQAVDFMLYADESEPEEPGYIPAGVPCVVWEDNFESGPILRWSMGNGKYSDHMQDGWSYFYDHARPVCFPDWSKVPHWVKALCLHEDRDGTWVCIYEQGGGKSTDPYYETRPEVTRD